MEKIIYQHEATGPSRSRKVIAAVTASLALFATGCRTGYSGGGEDSVYDPTAEDLVITKEIRTDGTRTIEFNSYELAKIYQLCDGPDLISQTVAFGTRNSGSGNSLSLTPNHAACEDGVITETDFQLDTETLDEN